MGGRGARGAEEGIGQVRCVEGVRCSEQVQQDGAGGREHRVGYAECRIVDIVE